MKFITSLRKTLLQYKFLDKCPDTLVSQCKIFLLISLSVEDLLV